MSSLTVLGSCGAWPEAGRACSGFVLDHAGSRIVLDLGYGTIARLLKHCDSPAADGIDAVIVTHQHADHCVDLHALYRVRWFLRRDAPPIPLFAPPGVIRALSAMDDDFATDFGEVFDWTALPSGPHPVGPFELTSFDLPHYVPNAGVRLAAPDVTVAYTGDTGPDPLLTDLGRDADLFMIEATDARRSTSPGTLTPTFHMTAAEAGQAATAAGAQRLLLTHFWPGIDREESRRQAEACFDGEVLVASEGLVVDLG